MKKVDLVQIDLIQARRKKFQSGGADKVKANMGHSAGDGKLNKI